MQRVLQLCCSTLSTADSRFVRRCCCSSSATPARAMVSHKRVRGRQGSNGAHDLGCDVWALASTFCSSCTVLRFTSSCHAAALRNATHGATCVRGRQAAQRPRLQARHLHLDRTHFVVGGCAFAAEEELVAADRRQQCLPVGRSQPYDVPHRTLISACGRVSHCIRTADDGSR